MGKKAHGFPFLLFVRAALLSIVVLFIITGFKYIQDEKVLHGNADFTIFMTALHLLDRYPASQLYNPEKQQEIQLEILQGYQLAHGMIPFNHPPFELFYFFPLKHLNYPGAFILWLIVNLFFVAGLCYLLSLKELFNFPIPTDIRILYFLSFYPFWVTLVQGQDSLLYTVLIAASWIFIIRDKHYLAGFLFGLSFFKFHLSAFLLIPLIFKRQWRILAAAAGAIILQSAWYGSFGALNLLYLT